MGFADLLIQLGIPYASEAALGVAEEIMTFIRHKAHQASAELAERRGTFPAWPGSIYDRPDGPRMRNSAPTTIAPTGTISIIAGASSGVEPLFALSYVRNVMDNTRLVEGYPYFQAVAKHEGFYSPELMEQLAERGSLETIDVPQWVKDVFRTSHDINPEWHVRMQAAFQKHTDNSVSKTINFPKDATVDEVRQAYMLAYDLGCKGITVYRDGSKEGQVLSFAGSEEHEEPEPSQTLMPRERPQTTHGVTERVRTGHGNMYVTINFEEDTKPFEVFGTLGKAGGCDSAQLEAISRLVSLALRSGIDPANVIEQLRGITCCPAWDSGTLVRSSPDALALAMERHLDAHGHRAGSGDSTGTAMQLTFTPQPVSANGNGHQPAKKCPDCNGPVIFQEGCQSCVACGWNKCE
jgi:ribonucleoside-diphosphate reductase alpha chain